MTYRLFGLEVEIEEVGAPLFESLDVDPQSPFSVQVEGNRTRVEWARSIQFELDESRKHIKVYSSALSKDIAYHYLIPHVLSFPLIEMGKESLHATAVEKGGRAIALIGDSGRGKSTIAAACIAHGWRLLTDDLLVLDNRAVLPGVDRIKLTPAVMTALLGQREGAPMDDERGKFVYRLRPDEFCNQERDLAGLVLIEPGEDFELQRIEGAAAFRSIAAATFNPLVTSAARLRAHMLFVAELLQRTPVYTLQTKHGLTLLSQAVQLIESIS